MTGVKQQLNFTKLPDLPGSWFDCFGHFLNPTNLLIQVRNKFYIYNTKKKTYKLLCTRPGGDIYDLYNSICTLNTNKQTQIWSFKSTLRNIANIFKLSITKPENDTKFEVINPTNFNKNT